MRGTGPLSCSKVFLGVNCLIAKLPGRDSCRERSAINLDKHTETKKGSFHTQVYHLSTDDVKLDPLGRTSAVVWLSFTS